MTQPTPAPALACSLSAAEAAERAARWRALLDTRLLSRTTTTSGQRLAFPTDAAAADELDALIAAERDCCPFLGVTVERFDGALILDVSVPPDAAPIVDTMFGAAS
jgi:MerR family transcriptional regulator, copper efflux regulator